MKPKVFFVKFSGIMAALFLLCAAASAQTTEFTYQGKLADTGTPSPTYDFEFRLCASETNCPAPLAVLPQSAVAVSGGGIFTVKLNFGANFFDGSDRFLEIAVKRPSESAFTTLAPRQKLTSAPYTIQSLKSNDAQNLGGTAANQYVKTDDSRLNANNYVQNSITPQPTAAFNIGGTGTANAFNASTQFNLGGNRVLSNSGTGNLFAGVGAGAVNSGQRNSFFGDSAGRSNSSGDNNSFFGSDAGMKNTTGFQNSFFGREAGLNNSTGNFNSFFGRSAGSANSTGEANSFFGQDSGIANTSGGGNAFYGAASGQANTTGGGNSFFGTGAGQSNKTGSNNTIIGANANVGADNLSNVTVIGSGAVANASNTVVLGRSADTVQIPGTLNISGTFGANVFNAQTQYNLGGSRILSGGGSNNLFAGVGAGAVNTGVANSFFGRNAGAANSSGNNNSFFGLNAGVVNTTGGGNAFYGLSSGQANTTGGGNSFFGTGAGQSNKTGSDNTIIGSNANLGADNLTNSVAIGSGVVVNSSNTIALGRTNQKTVINGNLVVTGGAAYNNTNAVMETVTDDRFGTGLAVSRFYIGSSPLLYLDAKLCHQGDFTTINYQLVGFCASTNFTSSYKTDIKPFSGGLDVVKRLNPVSFKWKENGDSAVGLNADEVALTAPQIVSRSAAGNAGEVQDIKENTLNLVLINAVKEQQKLIENQQKQIDELKKLVCATNSQAEVCTGENK